MNDLRLEIVFLLILLIYPGARLTQTKKRLQTTVLDKGGYNHFL